LQQAKSTLVVFHIAGRLLFHNSRWIWRDLMIHEKDLALVAERKPGRPPEAEKKGAKKK
jgi:hypothetical protein